MYNMYHKCFLYSHRYSVDYAPMNDVPGCVSNFTKTYPNYVVDVYEVRRVGLNAAVG